MREKKKDRYTEREIEGRERGERGEREGRERGEQYMPQCSI